MTGTAGPTAGGLTGILLPEHTEGSSGAACAAGWILYLGAVIVILGMLSPAAGGLGEVQRASAIGLVGLWRWSWAAMHFVRMLVYTKHVFPRLRREASAAKMPPCLGLLVTSYRMSAELNTVVYGALLDELERAQVSTLR